MKLEKLFNILRNAERQLYVCNASEEKFEAFFKAKQELIEENIWKLVRASAMGQLTLVNYDIGKDNFAGSDGCYYHKIFVVDQYLNRDDWFDDKDIILKVLKPCTTESNYHSLSEESMRIKFIYTDDDCQNYQVI